MRPLSEAAVPHRVPGSFRDPSGYVFRQGERVFRAIDPSCHDALRELNSRGLLGRLVDEGLIARTTFVEDPPLLQALGAQHPGYSHFLEHDPIQPVTYPYEWCVSMLADAAILTLDLQVRLVEAGFALKDATAYNILFDGGRARFIDLSSIERPRRLDVWFALGQFMQMFLFPLMLTCDRRWDLRSYFLPSLNGRSAEQVVRALGWLERWRPRSLLDITLPAFLTRSASAGRWRGQALGRPSSDTRAQVLNLGRLRRKVKRLAARYKPAGGWHAYESTCGYGDAARAGKRRLVERVLETHRPTQVLDLGCNAGEYSLLAAQHGARVIASDADHDAVEVLYRRLRTHPASVTPVVMDICNPSPAIGFMNIERPSFLERIRPDCVFALALIHHLHVTGNLPLDSICELLANLTGNLLVLEFVPRDDPQFETLLRFRVDLFADYDLQHCKRVFSRRFELVGEDPIPASARTLLVLHKSST